jgi:two-component system sensor histidine kinase VicK
MVENIYETMRGEANKNEQTLTFKKGKNVPVIYADKERIERVLVNIVSNAIKYTPKGGKIETSLNGFKIKSGGFDIHGAKITVKDNGIGIPKEDLPHIFERFYRVEKARSTEAGGTGLGLSIAKEIINAHKGEISVENAQGGGTVVTIILPQNKPQDVEEAEI